VCQAELSHETSTEDYEVDEESGGEADGEDEGWPPSTNPEQALYNVSPLVAPADYSEEDEDMYSVEDWSTTESEPDGDGEREEEEDEDDGYVAVLPLESEEADLDQSSPDEVVSSHNTTVRRRRTLPTPPPSPFGSIKPPLLASRSGSGISLHASRSGSGVSLQLKAGVRNWSVAEVVVWLKR
jgi:hypothetical protein